MISCLGWNIYNIDEVFPEYSVGNKKVDYSLRYNNYNKVFIEVKKIDEELEKHQEQLLNYSFQEGIKLAILTNGITWWFYLPIHEGNWEQRKFYTVEIYDQGSNEIVQKFIEFLSKEKVVSGEAVKYAENIFKSKQKQILINKTMPEAWNKIIKEPDEILIELIAETTEKLCGYKPDNSTVVHFIDSKNLGLSPTTPYLPIRTPPVPVIRQPKKQEYVKGNYSNKSISSFTFRGKSYEVKSWKDMLIQVCNIMSGIHREHFEKVLNLKGRKRPYFTNNPNELRIPQKITATNIYVEVNLGANSIVRLSQKVIALFGYSKDDLLIHVYRDAF